MSIVILHSTTSPISRTWFHHILRTYNGFSSLIVRTLSSILLKELQMFNFSLFVCVFQSIFASTPSERRFIEMRTAFLRFA